MIAPPAATNVKTYCNRVALDKGLDPGGHASSFDTLLLLEAPLPWRRDMYDVAGAMPQELLDLFALLARRYQETGVWEAPFILLIAPDEQYSQAGRRRVIRFQRDRELLVQFARTEYLVPENEAGRLMWALAEEPQTAAWFDEWRTAAIAHPARDVLVCTHGTVDAACAKFGYPLYRHLRRTHANESVRVWRVSHFGGHVFAPTLMDMPSGRFWAYVEEAQADQIMRHDGAVADLRGHYRGWAGLESGFMMAAEREMWQREGWRWFDWPKCGEVVARDGADTPTWVEVRVLFDADDGRHSYHARVELSHTIDTIHTTGYEQTYPHAQYRVAWMERS